MPSDIQTVASVILHQESDNSHGEKFYQAAVLFDATVGALDRYWVIFNWGAGHGVSGYPTSSGQIAVEGHVLRAGAMTAYMRKLTAKENGGYTRAAQGFEIEITQALREKLGLAPEDSGTPECPPHAPITPSPKAKPAKTFTIDVVGTLVSQPMTPALVGKLIDQREKLLTLRERQLLTLDGINHKVELINQKLASGE